LRRHNLPPFRCCHGLSVQQERATGSRGLALFIHMRHDEREGTRS
jgi:hypothetical protein